MCWHERHDPALAKTVFSVYSRLSGRRSYSYWLKHYVKPLAEIVEAVDGGRDEKMQVFCVRLPPSLVERIDRISANRSKVIRMALEAYLQALQALEEGRSG